VSPPYTTTSWEMMEGSNAETKMIESFGATDVGRRRKLNGDSLLVDSAIGLFVVADGMGGA